MRPSCPPHLYGKPGTAAHAESDKDGREKRHKGIRRPYCCQNRHPGIPAHNERIHHIVQLLEHIPGHKGKSKKENLFTYGSSCKINLHAQNLLVGKKQE